VAKLPKWVQDNTAGVLYSTTSNPWCLVGPYMLKVGDRVPRQVTKSSLKRSKETTVYYRRFWTRLSVQVTAQEGGECCYEIYLIPFPVSWRLLPGGLFLTCVAQGRRTRPSPTSQVPVWGTS